MRVGVDASPLRSPVTGVGNYILALLQAMMRARADLEFILYSNAAIIDEAAAIGQVRISPGRRLPGPIWMDARLRPALSRDSLDVMWFTNGFMPFLMPKNIPTVLTVHDLAYRLASSTMRPVARTWRGIMQPHAVRTTSRLIAVSEATAIDVLRLNGRQVDAVINPLVMPIYRQNDALGLSKIKEKYSLPDHFVFSIGTQEPRKNLVALIRAYLKVAANNPTIPLLVLAGGVGWRDSAIREAVKEGERLKVVRSFGYLDQADLPYLYELADLFVMASTYEGFGMPVLEAQRCGTPVAISDISSLREAAGQVAITFEPTVEGIAKILSAWAQGRITAPIRPRASLTDQSPAASKAMLAQLEAACDKRS